MLQKLQAIEKRSPSQANTWSPSQVVRGSWINCIAASTSANDLERLSSTATAGPLRSCKVCGRALALGRPRNVNKQAGDVTDHESSFTTRVNIDHSEFWQGHAAFACLVLTSLPATPGTVTSCCQQHEQAFGKTCNDTEPCATHSLAAICRVVVPA